VKVWGGGSLTLANAENRWLSLLPMPVVVLSPSGGEGRIRESSHGMLLAAVVHLAGTTDYLVRTGPSLMSTGSCLWVQVPTRVATGPLEFSNRPRSGVDGRERFRVGSSPCSWCHRGPTTARVPEDVPGESAAALETHDQGGAAVSDRI